MFVMGKTIIQPSNPHFFQPIMPGSLQEISIPKAFMRNYLVGEKCEGKATLKSNKSSKSWTVGIKGFCFKDGWEDFATQHDLHIGDILVFKHEGGLVFHVLVFDSSSCEKKYPPLAASTGPKNIKKLKTVKMKKRGFPGSRRICNHCGTDSTPGWRLGPKGPKTLCDACGLRYRVGKLVPEYRPVSNLTLDVSRNYEEKIKKTKTPETKISKNFSGTVMVRPPPEDPPQFTVTLQRSYFAYSSFPIPMDFARENGLIKECRKCKHGSVPIILEDPKAKTWNACLKYKPSKDSVYIRKGWPDFSSANNFKVGDVCTFELVSGWSKTIVMKASICKS